MYHHVCVSRDLCLQPHPLMPGPWVAVHTCQAAPLLAALQRQQGQWPASTPQQGMEATMPEELDGLRVVQDAFDRPPSAATDTGGSDNTFCEGFAAAVAASVGDVAVCLSGPVRSCERQDVDEESSVGFPPALMYLRLWYNLTCRRLLSG